MSQKEYHRRWYEKLKADPERYAEYLRKVRKGNARIKADPERRAEIARKAAERDRERLARLKADPEKLAERRRYTKEWQDANKERVRESKREYNRINLEKMNQGRTKWAKDNPEKRAEIMRKYQKAHPEVGANTQNKRRAFKSNSPGGHHTKEEWQALKSYYMDQCLCCGDVPDVLERDHVVPLSKGGSDEISNIQCLCRPCNRSKGTKTTDYR